MIGTRYTPGRLGGPSGCTIPGRSHVIVAGAQTSGVGHTPVHGAPVGGSGAKHATSEALESVNASRRHTHQSYYSASCNDTTYESSLDVALGVAPPPLNPTNIARLPCAATAPPNH